MFGKEVSISRFLLVGGFLNCDFARSDMLADAADIARGTALGRLVASYHLGEKVHIVIAFPRHLFADGLQLFKKPGAFIHKITENGEQGMGNGESPPTPHSPTS
jgi:hypothetical protein